MVTNWDEVYREHEAELQSLRDEIEHLQSQLAEAYRHCDVQAEAIRGLNMQLAEAEARKAQAYCDWLRQFFHDHQGNDELTAQEANTIRNTLNELVLTGDTGKPSVVAQIEGVAASRLEPLATRLREATVYCTEMPQLESHCIAIAEELELLARDLDD